MATTTMLAARVDARVHLADEMSAGRDVTFLLRPRDQLGCGLDVAAR